MKFLCNSKLQSTLHRWHRCLGNIILLWHHNLKYNRTNEIFLFLHQIVLSLYFIVSDLMTILTFLYCISMIFIVFLLLDVLFRQHSFNELYYVIVTLGCLMNLASQDLCSWPWLFILLNPAVPPILSQPFCWVLLQSVLSQAPTHCSVCNPGSHVEPKSHVKVIDGWERFCCGNGLFGGVVCLYGHVEVAGQAWWDNDVGFIRTCGPRSLIHTETMPKFELSTWMVSVICCLLWPLYVHGHGVFMISL